jgi:hypothetical protein
VLDKDYLLRPQELLRDDDAAQCIMCGSPGLQTCGLSAYLSDFSWVSIVFARSVGTELSGRCLQGQGSLTFRMT